MRDDEGYVDFVAARWTAFHRLAYLLTASRPAAEDLLRAALMKTYAGWPRIRGMEERDVYVLKVIVNTFISERRRPRTTRESPREQPPETEVEPAHSDVHDHELLWPLICALPDRQRAVVVLRYYEDLSEEEIDEALGGPRGTVRSEAFEALRSLRRALAAVETPSPSRVGEP
jgi:RNA polymerase sigma-70 factor (sigma-E family)